MKILKMIKLGLSLGIRNMMRQRSRSFLTALSIFVAALIICLTDGWMRGVVHSHLSDFSVYQTAHIRITTKDYKKRERFFPVDEYFSDSVRTSLDTIEGIDSIESRTRFGLLLSVGEKTVVATGIGVEPSQTLLPIKESLIKGTDDLSGIVIGEGLAKKCGVDIGDPLMIVTRTSEGGMNAIKKPITGIIKMSVGMYDNNTFITSKENVSQLLKLEENITELYVYLSEFDEDAVTHIQSQIDAILPKELGSYSLMEQMGGLYNWIKGANTFLFILECLIMILASVVIINSMYMSILERRREIGLMKSLGMSNKELFLNFTIEGALIGIIGGIPGLFVGYGLVYYFYVNGLNFEEILSTIDFPINYMIYPSMSTKVLFVTGVMVIVIPSIVAMIPARSILKLQASEALKK